jgi:lipid II:glycine glycyltransferase (peptidoglycan interpeptide bridge formation enzyme)
VDRGQWDAFVADHPAGHLLQTWAWGELKARFGWRAMRLGLLENGKLAAGAQILFRPLPLGFRLAYVPKGPLVEWSEVSQANALLAGMHRLCRAQRSALLKIEPHAAGDSALHAAVDRQGFAVSPFTVQPPRTILVDLCPSEEDMLDEMKQKTRYNIRLATRKGVSVRPGRGDDLATFHRLMQITGERDRFAVHSLDYFRSMFELFGPDRAGLLLAEVEGEAVAGLVVLVHSTTAYYLFGASSHAHRKKMPAYLLQWEAMRWAKIRGCRAYDLWGIPDVDEAGLESDFVDRSQEPSGLWGVYRFKRGFGGQVVRAAGAFDFAYHRPLYWLYRMWMLRRREGTWL